MILSVCASEGPVILLVGANNPNGLTRKLNVYAEVIDDHLRMII